jgi:hypothetical protein
VLTVMAERDALAEESDQPDRQAPQEIHHFVRYCTGNRQWQRRWRGINQCETPSGLTSAKLAAEWRSLG